MNRFVQQRRPTHNSPTTSNQNHDLSPIEENIQNRPMGEDATAASFSYDGHNDNSSETYPTPTTSAVSTISSTAASRSLQRRNSAWGSKRRHISISHRSIDGSRRRSNTDSSERSRSGHRGSQSARVPCQGGCRRRRSSEAEGHPLVQMEGVRGDFYVNGSLFVKLAFIDDLIEKFEMLYNTSRKARKLLKKSMCDLSCSKGTTSAPFSSTDSMSRECHGDTTEKRILVTLSSIFLQMKQMDKSAILLADSVDRIKTIQTIKVDEVHDIRCAQSYGIEAITCELEQLFKYKRPRTILSECIDQRSSNSRSNADRYSSSRSIHGLSSRSLNDLRSIKLKVECCFSRKKLEDIGFNVEKNLKKLKKIKNLLESNRGEIRKNRRTTTKPDEYSN